MDDHLRRFSEALADRYQIERLLGTGGMAEVYLARDLRHRRKVAIKLLRPELTEAVGADRFLREIETAANLNHPNILPVYDSGEASGLLFYVMPFVEGESLRDRLAREKQLPIDEAVEIARSVAKALDYAHRQGVVHRDIKPGNVLIHEGQAQVADFGIAMVTVGVDETRLTGTGFSPGTPQYMSPEQATADREVDGRSDLYSLGCVLYEMLTGDPPHSGSTHQAVIARLLVDAPRLVTDLRATVPEELGAIVHKALAKLPADRFTSAAEMDDALAGRISVSMPGMTQMMGVSRASRPRWPQRLPWALTGVVLLGALFSLLRPEPRQAPRYVDVHLDDSIPLVFIGETFAGIGLPALALSPDGSQIAYIGPADNTTRIYVRSLNEYGTRPLPGTEGAVNPFYSPDGRWIGFFVNDLLYRVSPDGTQISPIAEAGMVSGGSWSTAGQIATVVADARDIFLTTPYGDDSRVVPLEREYATGLNEWIPGSEWLLASCWIPRVLCVMSSETGEQRPVTLNGEAMSGGNPRYVEGGYLVYSQAEDNVVMGVRFDPETLSARGDPVELFRGARRENFFGALHLSVSNSGDLLYAPGANAIHSHLVWAREGGVLDTLNFPTRQYGHFALAPNGRWLAVHIDSEVQEPGVWFLDLEQGTEQEYHIGELADDGAYQSINVGCWLPDSGRLVATALGPENKWKLILVDPLVPVGGEVLWEGTDSVANWPWPLSVTRDSTLYFGIADWVAQARLQDLGSLPPVVKQAFPAIPLSSGRPSMPSVSPDGEWLLYTSPDEGLYELYAQDLESEVPRRRLSYGGSEWSIWSPEGDGFFQRVGERYFWVALTDDPEEPFAEPELFADGNFLNVGGLELGVPQDGDRILLLERLGKSTTTELRLILNWRTVLEERLGG